MKILVFSLGAKGHSVVSALTAFKSLEVFCVIGEDAGVVDDYSGGLAELCSDAGFAFGYREKVTYAVGDYDMVLAVGWRWMIRDVDESKLLVFHDSLLPKYRGFAPLVSALINKEPKVGVTVLWGAEEYDKGHILLQKSLDVDYPTTIGREIQRISELYGELAADLISRAEAGSFGSGTPQREEDASYSLWRDHDDYRVNWDEDAAEIAHFITCVGFPYAGATALLNDMLVRIPAASSLVDVRIENRTPGKIIFNRHGKPVVVCGRGLLRLDELHDMNGQNLLPLPQFRMRFR